MANSARGERAARADEPRPLPRDDGAAAARARHADAVPGAGVRRLRAVPLLRRPRAASSATLVRKGRARVPGAVPAASPSPRDRRRARRSRATRDTFERCKLDLAERETHAEHLRAAPRSAAPAARGPGVPRAAAARRRRRGARRRRRSCCASSAERRRTTGCCSSTSAATCTSIPRRSRCSRRRTAQRWRVLLVERGPALRRRRHAAARDARTTGACPARRPSCSRRCRAGRRSGARRRATRRRRESRHGRAMPRIASVCDRAPAATRARCSTREWLVTNGLGGYASGTVAGRADAPLPRPADRRAAGAARAACDAQPPRGAAPAAGRHARSRSAARSARAAGSSWPGAQHLREFRLEAGLPVWRYELGGAVVEKRVLLPHRQNTVHVTYRLLDGRRPVRLQAAPVAPLPPARRRRSATPIDEPVRAAPPSSDRFEMSTAREHAAAAPADLRPRAPRSRSTAASSSNVFYRVEEQPRLRRTSATCGARATSASTSTADDDARRWSPRPKPGRRSARSTPERGARRRARAARSGCSPPRHPPRATGVGAELVLAADQFIITPGRPRRGRGARARRRRRGRAPSSPATTGSPTGAATR